MRILLIALGVVVALVADQALAEVSATLSVTARVVAPCTVTSANPESSCSEQTLAGQSDVTNASARISRSESDTTVTHKGGVPPRIERQGDRILVSF